MSNLDEKVERYWVLPGSLTIFDVKALETGCPALQKPSDNYSFDLQTIDEVDAAGIQWLLSVSCRLQDKGGSLTLRDVPEQVGDAIRMMGLDARLMAHNLHKEVRDD